MPYLSEEEIAELQTQVEEFEEKERLAAYNHKRALEDEKDNTRKFKIASIIAGIIALLGVAGTVYFMNFAGGGISQKDHDMEVADLNSQISELNGKIEEMSINSELDSEDPGEQGTLEGQIVYAVQIGAFEEKNLSMYSENFVNFREIKSEGFNKYAIGNFETLKEAQRFRREVVKLGFRNAFIASYRDDQRIKIEEIR